MNDPMFEPETNDLYFPGSGDDWESLSFDSLSWNKDLLPDLHQLLESNGTRAFIVLKDGKIVIEEYYGKTLAGNADFDKHKLWYWASAGKTLTSFLVGKAQEDAFLNIEDNSSTYLGNQWTSLIADQEEAITIKHQLCMNTGLDDGVSDPSSTLPEDLQFAATAGTRWAYHNAPYTLLDQVIETATGQSFEDYFNSSLQHKIYMNGYFSTARDMARFGLLMLNNGNWGTEEILVDKDYLFDMVHPSQNLNESYGYLWWLNGYESFMLPSSQTVFTDHLVPNAPDDLYTGLGKNGQYLMVIPSENLVVIRMGENPSESLVPLLFIDDIWEILGQIIL